MRSFSPAPRSTTASPSTRGPSKRSGAGMEGGGTLWSQAAGLGGRGVWSPPRRCVMLVPRLLWAAAPWLSDFPPSLCALRRWTRRWAGLAVRPPLGGGAPGSHHRQAARSRRIRLEQCVFSTRQTWRTDTDHADAAAKNFGESSSLARTQWGTFSPFRVTIPFPIFAAPSPNRECSVDFSWSSFSSAKHPALRTMCVPIAGLFHSPNVLQTNHDILVFDPKHEIRKLLVLANKQKEQRSRPAVKKNFGVDDTRSNDVSLPPPVRFHRGYRGPVPFV